MPPEWAKRADRSRAKGTKSEATARDISPNKKQQMGHPAVENTKFKGVVVVVKMAAKLDEYQESQRAPAARDQRN